MLLMILNGEKLSEAKSAGREATYEEQWRWQHLAVKKLLSLLRRITSKHHGEFYCLNSSHSFPKENKLQSSKRVCENKDLLML